MTGRGARSSRAKTPSSFLYEGNARKLDQLLPELTVDQRPLITATITSPPYGDRKNYGHPGQIGWGQSYDEYLADMRRIFRIIWSHTVEKGSLWLIADTLRPEERKNNGVWQLEPLPFHLAEQATDAGWLVRDIIIWKKDKTLPWSGKGRLRNTFEYIVLCVKGSEFKYNVDRIRNPVELEQWWVKYPERYNPQGKVPTNVWDIPIPVQGTWGTTTIQHTCPLPPDLVERLVLLSTDKGDVVFDPFAGSGVVVAEAERLGRRGVGVELVPRHVKAFKRVRKEVLERTSSIGLGREKQQRWLERRIIQLRVLKYPKTLAREIKKRRPELPVPELIVVVGKNIEPSVLREPHKLVESRTVFVVSDSVRSDEREELERVMKELGAETPCSKFGVQTDVLVVPRSELANWLPSGRLYLYTHGRTWKTEGPVKRGNLLKVADEHRSSKHPPVVSDVRVSEEPRRLSAEPV